MRLIKSTYHRRAALRGGLRGLPMALVAGLAGLLLMAPAQALGAGESLVITGAGDGHGVGMSQWGAFGFAEHGWTYQQILAHYYTGTTLGQAPAGRTIKVLIGSRVKTLPLETYVRGVVAAEVPSSWPLAALEAQAVASRTYAITADAGGSRFDVYADTRSQMYEGAAAETASSNAAIADTAGQIVTYGGKPAITYFFASSGGTTESVQNSFLGSAPEPWLVSVADPYDQGPLHRWTVTMSFAAAAKRLKGYVKGSFEGVEVVKRGVSPRIVAANVLGSAGRTAIGGPELAARLDLDSTWESFAVSSGGTVKPEPDVSGQTQPATAPSTAPAASEPPPATSPQGGAPAPSSASAAGTGGVSAG